MAKVRTFSRYYPKGHPKEGQATFFVEKLVKSLHQQGFKPWDIPEHIFSTEMYYLCEPKKHTIRAGNHFKQGDKFSPRVWSGKPYCSKQITIAPDLKIEKVFDIRIEIDKDYICIMIDDYPFYEENSNFVTQEEALKTLALNDGLLVTDFKSWFKWGKSPFSGQIICWSKDVEY